ncbi:MAG: efflux RND transporter periplasmic adaptor subunit [Verrucomicrobiia bacterium]
MRTKRQRTLPWAVLAIVAILGFACWRLFLHHDDQTERRKVLFYQDSMHPWIKSPHPGKCTICAMELTPIYEGDSGFGSAEGVVPLSTNSITVLNVQTDKVKRRSLHRALRVAGVLEADSTRKTVVGAPAPGRIDDVAVESAGIEVTRGQVLATFYSPDLTFQTRRYIFRDRLPDRTKEFGPNPFANVSSSRHAMAHPSPLNPRTDIDPFYNDLLSPLSGTVTERNVFDGQYVSEGDRLFAIVDCSVLWFRFDVYENQLSWLEPGQTLEVEVPAYPHKVFPAVIAVIEPTVNEPTRTIKVRAEVQNPLEGKPGLEQRLLRLGMYAEGRVLAQIPEALTIPRSAVLSPGGRPYVYVDKGSGAFEMRRLKIGRQGDDLCEVLEGLDEGERIVSAGSVLIDAQAQLSQDSGLDQEDAEMTEPTHNDSDARASGFSAAEPAFTAAEREVLDAFLDIADQISAALAADSVEQLARSTPRLAGTLLALNKEFTDDSDFHAIIQRIEATSMWPASANLAEARQKFLPFSTNVVELVQRLRTHDKDYRSRRSVLLSDGP